MKKLKMLGQHGAQSNIGATTQKLCVYLDPSALNTVMQRELYYYKMI